MALIAPARIYTDGATSKVAVYRVLGTTQADTIQLSADFTNITAAYFLPSTVNTSWNQPGPAGISANTLITLTNAAYSLNKDDGYLVVFGSST